MRQSFFSSGSESKEHRLLRAAEGGNEVRLDAGQLKNLKGKVTEETKSAEQKEAPTAQEEQKRIANLTDETNGVLAKNGGYLKSFPPDLQVRFKDELATLFATTVEAFDKNGVKGLSLQEFQDYKQSLLAKLEEQLRALNTQVDTKKDAVQKKQQEADELARKAELEKKTYDQALKETVEIVLQDPELSDVDKAALQDPEHSERMQAELAKHQANVQKVARLQESIAAKGRKIEDLHAKAQQELRLLSEGAEAASAGAAVAAGAAVGAAIGVWGFGIGAVVGAGIGAVVGGLAYGIGKGIAAETVRAEKEKKAQRFNQDLRDQKQAFETGKALALRSQETVTQNGTLLNGAPEALRVTQAELYGKQKAELGQRRSETADARTQREQSRQQLATALASLQARQASAESAQAVGTAATATERTAQLKAVVTALRQSLSSAPDQSAQIQVRLAPLEEALGLASAAGLDQADDKRKAEVALLSTQDAQVKRAEELAASALSALDLRSKSLEEQEATLDKGYEAQRDTLNTVDRAIGEGVFESNLHLAKAGSDIEAQSKALTALKDVEAPSFFSSLGDGFEGFAHAAKFVFKDVVAAGLDSASKWLKDNVPGVGTALAFPIDTLSGLSEGTGDLLEGVSTMLAHPVQTVQGLGALVGLNPEVSAADAWKAMGKFIIAYDDFAEGNAGKGIGKVGLNILLTATGAGAAGTGAKAASVAFRAARAAESGVLSASAKAALVGTRLGAKSLLEGAAKIPGEVVSTAGKVLKAPVSITRRFKTPKAARLGADAIKLEEKAAELAATIEKSALPAELKGMTAAELKAIAGDGAALAKYGVTDARTIEAFLELRKLAGELESAQTALSATLHQAELLEISEDLDGLTKAAGKKNPQEVRTFVDGYNTKNSLDPRQAYRIVEATAEGGLVAFDSSGFLTVVKTEDVSAFVKQAQEASLRATAGQKPLLRVPNNSDAARLRVAREVVGQKTPAQEQALLRTHRRPLDGTPGSYRADLKAKAEDLRAAGFTREETDALLRSGIAGDSEVVEAALETAKAAKPKPMADSDLIKRLEAARPGSGPRLAAEAELASRIGALDTPYLETVLDGLTAKGATRDPFQEAQVRLIEQELTARRAASAKPVAPVSTPAAAPASAPRFTTANFKAGELPKEGSKGIIKIGGTDQPVIFKGLSADGSALEFTLVSDESKVIRVKRTAKGVPADAAPVIEDTAKTPRKVTLGDFTDDGALQRGRKGTIVQDGQRIDVTYVGGDSNYIAFRRASDGETFFVPRENIPGKPAAPKVVPGSRARLGQLDVSSLPRVTPKPGSNAAEIYVLGKSDKGYHLLFKRLDGKWDVVNGAPLSQTGIAAERGVMIDEALAKAALPQGEMRLGRVKGAREDAYLARQPDGTFVIQKKPLPPRRTIDLAATDAAGLLQLRRELGPRIGRAREEAVTALTKRGYDDVAALVQESEYEKASLLLQEKVADLRKNNKPLVAEQVEKNEGALIKKAERYENDLARIDREIAKKESATAATEQAAIDPAAAQPKLVPTDHPAFAPVPKEMAARYRAMADAELVEEYELMSSLAGSEMSLVDDPIAEATAIMAEGRARIVRLGDSDPAALRTLRDALAKKEKPTQYDLYRLKAADEVLATKPQAAPAVAPKPVPPAAAENGVRRFADKTPVSVEAGKVIDSTTGAVVPAGTYEVRFTDQGTYLVAENKTVYRIGSTDTLREIPRTPKGADYKGPVVGPKDAPAAASKTPSKPAAAPAEKQVFAKKDRVVLQKTYNSQGDLMFFEPGEYTVFQDPKTNKLGIMKRDGQRTAFVPVETLEADGVQLIKLPPKQPAAPPAPKPAADAAPAQSAAPKPAPADVAPAQPPAKKKATPAEKPAAPAVKPAPKPVPETLGYGEKNGDYFVLLEQDRGIPSGVYRYELGTDGKAVLRSADNKTFPVPPGGPGSITPAEWMPAFYRVNGEIVECEVRQANGRLVLSHDGLDVLGVDPAKIILPKRKLSQRLVYSDNATVQLSEPLLYETPNGSLTLPPGEYTVSLIPQRTGGVSSVQFGLKGGGSVIFSPQELPKYNIFPATP